MKGIVADFKAVVIVALFAIGCGTLGWQLFGGGGWGEMLTDYITSPNASLLSLVVTLVIGGLLLRALIRWFRLGKSSALAAELAVWAFVALGAFMVIGWLRSLG